MNKLTLLAALVGAGITAASGIGHAAHAQAMLAEPFATRTVAIPYGDLDLGSSAGRASLDHRIRHGVRAACGEASPSDLAGRKLIAACRDDLTASLVAKRDAVFASAARRGVNATLVARR
jgi:UrcA family protein